MIYKKGVDNKYYPVDHISQGKYSDSELIIGLVGAVGTNLDEIINILTKRLLEYEYKSRVITISKDILTQLFPNKINYNNEYERITQFIEYGNLARKKTGDNSVLVLGIASEIMKMRVLDEKGDIKPQRRMAYIIKSLKHPEEVERLRELYGCGFYLIGVFSSQEKRKNYLIGKDMTESQAEELIERDADEKHGHGQHTRDTFQMADFFIDRDSNIERVKKSIWRILDLIFGNPYLTPTFDEFAMFMAFASSLRSADLSRQVGAVIACDNEIIASGANDCPQKGGGLYWPVFDETNKEICDVSRGRDYTRGGDSNKIEQARIINDIIGELDLDSKTKKIIKEKLEASRIKDITEYGRVVHAEMEALLMCARTNTSARGGVMYCTTFLCHNCAKHIIAAGIKKVFYIEPYPKSKAFEFHDDAISDDPAREDRVAFLPFMGIGPRRFFELFSVSLSPGYKVIRKNKAGYTIEWNPKKGRLRTQLLPYSYLEKETFATLKFNEMRCSL